MALNLRTIEKHSLDCQECCWARHFQHFDRPLKKTILFPQGNVLFGTKNPIGQLNLACEWPPPSQKLWHIQPIEISEMTVCNFPAILIYFFLLIS